MTAAGVCGACQATVEAAQNFCTQCGVALRGGGPAPVDVPRGPGGVQPRSGHDAVGEVATPTLVACVACGAVNADTRRTCGRCDLPLHDPPGLAAATGGDAIPAPRSAARPPAWRPQVAAGPPSGTATPAVVSAKLPPPERDSSGLLLAATAVAALVVVVVLASLLQQRDTAEGQPAPPEQVQVAIDSVRASSWLPPSGAASYGPRNLIDGDPSSAWNEAADGSGQGEWVELRLREPADVARLVIWNGHQKGELFTDNARVRTLRIEIGGSSFTAQLLDARGPQAVDLPTPVHGDTVRLTVQDTYPGRRYDDGALSEVEVRALASP